VLRKGTAMPICLACYKVFIVAKRNRENEEMKIRSRMIDRNERNMIVFMIIFILFMLFAS
jgi:hypothetical protein